MNATKNSLNKKQKIKNMNNRYAVLFSRISIRFVGFTVLATFLTGVIISLVLITYSQNNIHKETLNNSLTQAELIAEFTANYIKVIEENIVSFSVQSSLLNYINERSTQAATEMLVQFVQVQTNLDSSGLYDANGLQLAVGDPNATTIGQSFADREWFQKVKSTKLPFLSAPLKSRVTGNAVSVYAVPILNNQNQLMGVLAGSISLNKLSNVIAKINSNHEGIYEVVDLNNGGSIIAHRDPQMILTSVSESYTNMINLMLNGESSRDEITNYNGENELISYAPIPNLSWGVISITPSKIAYSFISELSTVSKVISAVIILIAAMLSGLFVLQMTKPINLLVEEIKEIGNGNLDYEIKTTGKDEIGDLSRAFSDMTKNLKNLMVSNERLIEEVDGRKSAENRLMILNETLEQKVLERTAQLETSNKELESFSYSVSHDLRAPLRHIAGFVELLNDHSKGHLDNQSQHYLEVISRATHDMGQLIDDLLSFSRIGKIVIESKKVDFNLLVKQVIENFELEVGDRRIEWNIGQLPIVIGDTEMLKLAMSNLISNALKFTSNKASTRIEIGSIPSPQNKNQELFYIKDNGAGFDMQYVDKLFGVFQRLHSQTDFPGTGIGLANVKRVILRHGGEIWAESVLEEGAVFYFTLTKYAEEKLCSN